MNDDGGHVGSDFQRLYDAAACGLLVTRANGIIVEANRTFCRWIGREPGELIGTTTMQSLLTVGGRIFHQTHWVPLLQLQGSVSEVKFEVIHKDGRNIPMIWNGLRRESAGVVSHELAVFPMEDRHKYEQELMLARRHAEDALAKERESQLALRDTQDALQRARALAEDRALFAEQMVGVVSHDLRNPLSVITMNASLIGRAGPLTERQQRMLGQIDGSTGRAIRLISDLLDFTQARVGNGLRVDLVELDAHAVVAASIDELRVVYPGTSLVHVTEGSGRCAGSADRLTQLLGNLVSNAVAYGAPRRPVTVTSTIDAKDFTVAVHNEGPPIPDAIVPTLFEPMTRGEGESAVHSIGLGLYIVRQIAKAHGGDVRVSSAEGVGTTFTTTIPNNVAAAGPASSPLSAAQIERARQQGLDRLEIAEVQDPAYDDIVRLAAETFEAPIALISLTDGDRQWFKARIGVALTEMPRDDSFCDYAIADGDRVLVVTDAAADFRFASHPLVTDEPGIRFYAGAPLITSSGHAVGTICVMDTQPRTLEDGQLKTLQLMAQQVVGMMESHVQGLLRRSETTG